MLAAWKAGGAFVPLDPESPAERLAGLLAGSGARTIVTDAAFLPRLPLTAAAVVCLDRDGGEAARQPDANPDVPVEPDQEDAKNDQAGKAQDGDHQPTAAAGRLGAGISSRRDGRCICGHWSESSRSTRAR